MSSLIDFFDRSYIINLPERRDRRRLVEQELKKFKVSFPSNKVLVFPAIKPTEKDEFPSIGAKGCFLSHLAILTEARDQHLKNVLIMEDDLAFSKRLVEYQAIVIAELQRLEWDIVYLGHTVPISSETAIRFQESSCPLSTTHFLAINGRIINRLVTFLEEVLKRPSGSPLGGPMHVDGAYSTFRDQNPEIVTLIAVPSLGFQRSSPSDIAGRQWFDQVFILRQLAGIARQVKTWKQRDNVS
jgi:hypothetical protein